MAALTDEDRQRVHDGVHGSPQATALFAAAMVAVNAYARASGCPLGNDMVRWLSDQTRAAHEALRTAQHSALASEVRPWLPK